MPSSSQRSNYAMTGITLLPTTASCLDSNTKATSLISNPSTMRLVPKYRHTIFDKWNCTLQLVPPDVHRRNIAKRATRGYASDRKSVV